MPRVVKVYRVSSYIGEAMVLAYLDGAGCIFSQGRSPFEYLPTDNGMKLPYDVVVCSDKRVMVAVPDTVQVGEQCL